MTGHVSLTGSAAFYRAAILAGLLLSTSPLLEVCSKEPLKSEPASNNSISSEQDRSPTVLAVSTRGAWCAVVNSGSESVSLVDLKSRQVVSELACGPGPSHIVWLDDRRLLLSLAEAHTLVWLRIDDGRLVREAEMPLGAEPRGIALASMSAPVEAAEEAARARRAFVALAGDNCVAVVDVDQRREVGRIPVGQGPNSVTISPDGKWLVTACSVSGDVHVHDAVTRRAVSRRTLFDDGANLGQAAILPDSSACILPHIANRMFPVNGDNIEKGWVLNNRITRLPLPGDAYWDQSPLGLDKRGDASGDPHAVAVSSSGEWLVVTCGGSHELLIFRHAKIRWPQGNPGDFIPYEMLQGDDRYRRLELGGRPLGVQFIDDSTALVANALRNSLQVVDVRETRVIGEIPLGGAATPGLARRGEAIFFDADRALNSWFSCHSCHQEGHTSGQVFDTLNDGTYDTLKLTPSLRGVTETAPYTWHGWQTSLRKAIEKSLTDTLESPQPVTESDLDALVAYLQTRRPRPAAPVMVDAPTAAAAERGRQVFSGKGACAKCHRGETLTAEATFDVGLGSNRDAFPKFNPPSLRGLRTRHRFLHDGRARSLEDVLTRDHRPENVAGERLTDAELRDLMTYLQGL